MLDNKNAPSNESTNKLPNDIVTQPEEIKCKDPAILFYTSDFIATSNLLSLEQMGKLALLMAYRHWFSRRLTYNEMLKICKDERNF